MKEIRIFAKNQHKTILFAAEELKKVRKHLRGTSKIANKSNYKEYCYNTVRHL